MLTKPSRRLIVETEVNWAQVKKTQEWFLAVMSGKMAANTFKGNWLDVDRGYLFRRLKEELDEYIKADKPAHQIQELGDVANVCMMLADKIAHEKTTT